MTIDMKQMRYINLFEKVSRVATKNCFIYNNQIVFVVPKSKVSKAIGKQAANVKKMSLTLRKRIKVIGAGDKKEDAEKFIKDLVNPVEIESVDIKDNAVTISGDRQAKAMLIGRNRIREAELKEILKKMFNLKEVKFS